MSSKLFELFIAVWDAVHDPKAFRAAVDRFNYVYKKCDYVDQGEYHRLVSDWMKETI